LGPTNYIITASDLKCTSSDNKLYKYADDTYLIVPSTNSSSIPSELAAIEQWATTNNLHLNYSKCTEMIVLRKSLAKQHQSPPVSAKGIARVSQLKILGVTMDCHLSVKAHIDNLIHISGQNLYALKTLKSHGISKDDLSCVCMATLINRILYAAPAWRGFVNGSEFQRLEAIFNRSIRWGVLSHSTPHLTDLMDSADAKLFSKVIGNPNHVLHSLLPPKKHIDYNLRPRAHDRVIPSTYLSKSKNFIERMIAKDSY
jgi:hypothetical protein